MTEKEKTLELDEKELSEVVGGSKASDMINETKKKIEEAKNKMNKNK